MSNFGRHWKLNLAMMSFSQLVIMTGYSAMMPFVPLYLKDKYGLIDEGQLGIYISLFTVAGTLAYALFNPIWGSLSDRWGVRPMLMRGTFGTAFIVPLMAYVPYVWLFIVLRFFMAACAGTTAASQTLIVKNTPSNKLGFALGTFSSMFWAGAMLGNVVGGLSVHYFGYLSTFYLCAALYFTGGIFVLFSKEDKSTLINTKSGVTKSQVNVFPKFTIAVWTMLLLMFSYNFVRNIEIPFVPILIEQIVGKDTAAYWTGITSAFVSVGALLSGVFIGYMSDRVKPQKIIIPAFVISVILLLLQAFATNLWVFGISRTLMYFFLGGILPVFQKILSGVTPKQKRGKVFGWATTFNGLGLIAASGVGGAIIYLMGTRATFWVAAIAVAALIPLSVKLTNKVMAMPFYIANAKKK